MKKCSLDSHILTQLLLCLSPPPHSQNSEMVFNMHCFYFHTSHSYFTPFRLPPPHSTQRTFIKFTSGLLVTKSNGWFSSNLTCPLNIILYCWKCLFFLGILYIFLPLPSIMPHCLGFILICLDVDIGPNLFSLYNCSQKSTDSIATSNDYLHRPLLWAPSCYVAPLIRYLMGALHPIINTWSILSSRTSLMSSNTVHDTSSHSVYQLISRSHLWHVLLSQPPPHNVPTDLQFLL